MGPGSHPGRRGSQRDGRAPNPDADLIDRLSSTVLDGLRPLVPAGSTCALIGFPEFDNVGDSAVWLGALEAVRRCGARIGVTASAATYDADAIRRRLSPDGAVLLTGGGNLGDLWVHHQRLRERVIEDFPDRPVVVLPQSLWFEDPAEADRAAEAFRSHPSLTVIVRDAASLERAGRLGIEALMLPDLAFVLPDPDPGTTAEMPVLWMRRSDKEATPEAAPPPGAGAVVADWTGPADATRRSPSHLAAAAAYRLAAGAARRRRPGGRPLPGVRAGLDRASEVVARQRVERGCRLLAGAQVVVADRLHAHVLCLLLGVPHVLMDNSYGKVRALHQSWTSASTLCHWADTAGEALDMARELAGRP